MRSMTRSPGRRLATHGLLVSLLFPGACALDAGDPWGELSVSLEVAPLIEDDRDLDGLWVTSRDYLIDLDRAELDVESVAFIAKSDAIAFDPSNPPEGYSLCHNGHCHHTSGRLVDYEDINNELALAGAQAPLFVIPAQTIELDEDESSPVELGLCSVEEPCVVDSPTSLETAVVTVSQLSLSGRVLDRRTGERARLPEEGVPFSTVISETQIPATTAVSFGPREALRRALRLRLTIPATLFDDIDWADTELSGSTEAMSSRLGRDGSVTVETMR
jgi:hypothetical protein